TEATEVRAKRSGRFRLGGRMPVHVTDEVTVAFRPVPARNRDVELGIAPHSVLGDVQPRSLDVLLDADAPETLHRPQAAERGGEGERTDGDEPERLDAELGERSGVH